MTLEQALILMPNVQVSILIDTDGTLTLQYKPTRNHSELSQKYLQIIKPNILTETIVTRIFPTDFRYMNVYVLQHEDMNRVI